MIMWQTDQMTFGLHDSGTSEGEPKAVFNALAWSKYTFKTNNFNTKKLLKDFSIKADKNFNQLDNFDQIDDCSI